MLMKCQKLFMNIFNSLGSNYDLKYLCNSFFALFQNNQEKLINILKNKYGGNVLLFYKGREAIEASLRLSDLEKGDYVAINGFTCYVVEKAVRNAGFKCEYLDVDNNLNFSSETLQKALLKNRKIRAVIVQNTLGNISDYSNIKDLCLKNNLVLIEDLAHTTTSNYADFTALSFSQDKAIDSVSGGALIIRNKKYLNSISRIEQSNISYPTAIKDIFYPLLTFLIRNLYPFGIGKILHFLAKKFNILSTPMDSDRNKLHFLPKWHANMAYYYLNKISQINSHRKEISELYGSKNTIIRYPIMVDRRQDLINYMKKHGVYISDIWYDYPVGPKKISQSSDYKIGQCPNAETIAEKIVNLPTHINVTISDAQNILKSVKIWQNTN